MFRNIKILFRDADELDMFDDVPLKHLKNIIDVEGEEFNMLDEYDGDHIINVTLSVQDTQERNREGHEIYLVIYEFELNYHCNFTLSRRFTWLSPYGKKLNKVLCIANESDEETDEEDVSEEEDEEEEPTSVIDL